MKNDWGKKRVLVTGAGGFIGSHLVERLVELGAQTRALVRYTSNGGWGWLDGSPLKQEVDVRLGDICDADNVRDVIRGVDIVFHLAALIGIPYSYQAPRSYVQTNVVGTLNVLQACRELGIERVICTSTSEVYGTARHIPIDENHPLQGQSPYSASKIAADKMAESFNLSFDLPVSIARPFNTYGPRQSSRAVIPAIITQALKQEVVHLGALSPTRDFNFVTDTVSGFVAIAENSDAIGQVINLGAGYEISIGDLVARVGVLLGKAISVDCEEGRLRPENSEVERLCADNSKARRFLGWQPRVSLDEGLRRTIAWTEANIRVYRVGTYQR